MRERKATNAAQQRGRGKSRGPHKCKTTRPESCQRARSVDCRDLGKAQVRWVAVVRPWLGCFAGSASVVLRRSCKANDTRKATVGQRAAGKWMRICSCSQVLTSRRARGTEWSPSKQGSLLFSDKHVYSSSSLLQLQICWIQRPASCCLYNARLFIRTNKKV